MGSNVAPDISGFWQVSHRSQTRRWCLSACQSPDLGSSTRWARPEQFPQISILFPRLRLTHSRSVRFVSSISCRYTLYPGHPKIRLNSRSVILQQFTALLHIPAQSRFSKKRNGTGQLQPTPDPRSQQSGSTAKFALTEKMRLNSKQNQ